MQNTNAVGDLPDIPLGALLSHVRIKIKYLFNILHMSYIPKLMEWFTQICNWMCLFFAGTVLAVEVHFENKDSGFFLKHTARWSGAGPPPEPMGTALPGALLSLDRFTVLQGSAPASVRATYGPFSTKQTVPARYAVPDPLEPPRRNATLLELQEATAHRLDVSAHLVFRELPRDAPVLRVLFHTGGEGGARRAAARPRRVCITLHASLGSRTLTATCGPEGEEGACLAELTVPAAWWPADGKGKRPPRTVKLAYSAAEAGSGETGDGACGRVSVQPAWPLGSVTLAGARAGYREARAGDAALLLPRAPLYPHSRLHLPFVVRRDTSHTIGHVVIRYDQLFYTIHFVILKVSDIRQLTI